MGSPSDPLGSEDRTPGPDRGYREKTSGSVKGDRPKSDEWTGTRRGSGLWGDKEKMGPRPLQKGSTGDSSGEEWDLDTGDTGNPRRPRTQDETLETSVRTTETRNYVY